MYSRFVSNTLTTASKIAQGNFGKVSGITKPNDSNQVLTETDLEIGKFIIENIQSTYPNHNIIDEEIGVIDKGSKYTWVIDPIDGTSNFAVGSPLYGIMLGLLEDSTPIVGGVVLPQFSQMFIAEKGKGASCNEHAIKVSHETNLLSCLVAYLIDGHQENPQFTERETTLLSKIILGVRNIRTTGGPFDAMMVAMGKYGGYLNQTSKIWDNVAPHIIIEEAGGVYTDFFGNAMDYSSPLAKTEQNFTQCAASPILHQQLQNIIHGHI